MGDNGDQYFEEDEEEHLSEEDDETGHAGGEDEDSKVQRKLHLFQCASVQQSIKRLWDMLPKDNEGQLVMEGYVELNLRLQKALTQEFVLERAIDSAIGDWGEDIRDGQRGMAADEFAMFLFELCSLWCGPSVSLLVYLLFLNATFIAVTDARGAHTVGLRPLVSVERLPQPFFDLLSVQGWARQPEDGAGLDADQALNAWLVRNLSPEREQATRLQVQRQVFQVTHDVRSVLLFQDKGPDTELLDLVKHASKSLEKVAPVEHRALGNSVDPFRGQPPAGQPAAELFSRPWCPTMRDRPPPATRMPDPQSPLRSKPGAKLRKRATSVPMGTSKLGSQPGELTLGSALAYGDWEPRRSLAIKSAPSSSDWESNKPPPRGRAFDTKPTRLAAVSLKVAGQAAVSSATTSSEAQQASAAYSAEYFDRAKLYEASVDEDREDGCSQSVSSLPTSIPAAAVIQRGASPASVLFGSEKSHQDNLASAVLLAASASATVAPSTVVAAQKSCPSCPAASGKISRGVSPAFATRANSALASTPPVTSTSPTAQWATAKTELEASEDIVMQQRLQNAVTFLVDTPAAVPYKLPRHPAKLYHQQTDPIIKTLPADVLNAVNKWQDANPLVNEPFERVLRKLPPEIRPSSAGPTAGPFKHPNEPIWFEMVHRLNGILRRQGRRADRRRKRKLRSKLFHGRSKHATTKRDEGKDLREYLDRHKTEFQYGDVGQAAGIPRPPGEFLGRVHENYLLQRERLENRPFRIRSVGMSVAGKKGVGEILEHKHNVVRPVYVPPPPSSMASY